jgi:7-carboxy-7-deazaguanine synthase
MKPHGITLPIYETFYAWQGEGCHMGRAAFFIRTFGCPVKCPWCDSAGTWHPEWTPEKIDRVSVDELVYRAVATNADFVVITGGEPAIHDLSPLTAALATRKLPAHLETSGGFPIRGDLAWITVSPKWGKLPLPENLKRSSEIKLIVEDETSIERWWQELMPHHRGQPVWLHPEWSQRNNLKVMNSISAVVKERGAPFRAGYQLHRLYDVDALDSRSRPTVPLGGNSNLGR